MNGNYYSILGLYKGSIRGLYIHLLLSIFLLSAFPRTLIRTTKKGTTFEGLGES